MATWQLQDAKNKFSALVERATKEGPQFVTRRGVKTVVVMSVEEYERLRPERDFKAFLESFPAGDFSVERSDEPARKIEF